jgi:hypothetical protein
VIRFIPKNSILSKNTKKIPERKILKRAQGDNIKLPTHLNRGSW